MAVVLRTAADGIEVLVMGRIKDGRHYATLPGGGVEPGEVPETAALRELTEETSLVAQSASYLTTIDDELGRTIYYLAGDAHGDVALSGPELERQSAVNHYDPHWCALDDLDRLGLMPPTASGVVRAAVARSFAGDRPD